MFVCSTSVKPMLFFNVVSENGGQTSGEKYENWSILCSCNVFSLKFCVWAGLCTTHTKSQGSIRKTHEIFFLLLVLFWSIFTILQSQNTFSIIFKHFWRKFFFGSFSLVLLTFSLTNTQKVFASKGKMHFVSFLTKFWYILNQFL